MTHGDPAKAVLLKISFVALALWAALCLQGPTLALSDKGPAQASTPPKNSAAVTAFMPQPRSIDYGDGWLPVKGAFHVEWLGYRNFVLDHAVLRFQSDVALRTGLDAHHAGPVQLRVDCRGADNGYLTVNAREHYSLAVKDDSVVLTADGPAGVLHGLATLRQSITNVPGGFAIPVMTIDDAPRFAWRGMMIDITRHFYSVPTLRRQIDTMERVKCFTPGRRNAQTLCTRSGRG